MKVEIDNNSLIACICEGGAERAILDILIENNCLIFNKKQLIDNDFISRTDVRDFENNYLKRDYGQQIIILRVIDSRSEKFPLKPVYQCQVKKVINVITAPEIEMIVIANEDKLEKWADSGLKPSIYCKSILGLANIKKYDYIKKYFSDYKTLIKSIKKYCHYHKQSNNEAVLLDIIKKEL